jgi:hypothetical protein
MMCGTDSRRHKNLDHKSVALLPVWKFKIKRKLFQKKEHHKKT